VIDRISVVRGAVEDAALIEHALREHKVEVVFHLAAQTVVGVANQNPLPTFETNIRGTWNVLDACRRLTGIKAIIVASSDKAYGEHKNLPYGEDAPLKGSHPYDVSKTCVDMLAAAYAKTYRLPIGITRFGNLFGGGDLNLNRLIPGTIRSVVQEEAPVIRSDGLFTRDYVYVEDAARAYLLLAEKMMLEPDKLGGEAFNFSYESPKTALQVVSDIIALMGRKGLKPRVLNVASNEIPHQYLSSKKAREQLRWKPLFSFEEGLRRTIPWYEEFFKKGDVS
jgi:CDP-glucose 4,6-dehydratase